MHWTTTALSLLLLLPLLHQGVEGRAEIARPQPPPQEDNHSLPVKNDDDFRPLQNNNINLNINNNNDSESKQLIRVGPETTQVRLGENVYLCCIVDHQRGKAQWTKDGFALGFNRTVPGYPRYRYVGNETIGEHHLVIRGATMEDEGEYECQVGPSATDEAVWSGANVTVMVPPRKIVMVGWGNGAVAEVMEGTKLKLECLLLDAKPAPSVAWYRNNLRIDPSHHYEVTEESDIPKMVSVRSHLIMRTDARDDGHKFSCRAIHPAIMYSQPPLVAAINLAVFHPPGRPVISEYATGEILRAGENRILVCHVFGGNPSPKVMWFRHGRPQNQMAAAAAAAAAGSRRGRRDGVVTSAHSANQRKASGGVFVSQQVIATREEDGAIYECRVSSDLLSKPYTTNVTLTVQYPPQRVEVRGPAAVAIGEDFSLTCVTAPSSPAAAVSWVVHGSTVSASTTTVSEHSEGGWVTTSKLTRKLIRTKETRDLTEASVECKADHPATLAGVRGVHVISILERPGQPVVEVEGDGQVTAGDEVSVLCTTRGGNPPPDMKLFKGDQKLSGVKVDSDGSLSWARVMVRVNASDNGQKILCEATNLASATPTSGHTTLDVNFAPWEVKGKVTPRDVDAGQMVKVTCDTSSSVPPSTVAWRFLPGPDTLAPEKLPKPTAKHLPGLYGGTITRSKLRIRVRAEDKGRVLRCEADNGLGLMVATNITLDVLHGPVWEVTPHKRYEIKEGGNLNITVFAQANPGPVSYKWQKGKQQLEGTVTENLHGVLTLNNIQRLQAGNYTVLASSSKGFLPTYFTISVLYGPLNISVPERVLADQNKTVNIKCRANGNPTPNVTWTKASDDNGVVLAHGLGEAVLELEGATKADTGFYLCRAANLVSALPPAYSALVVTQSPTTITAGLNGEVPEDEGEDRGFISGKSWAQVGGGALLDCRVKASPQPSFNWTRSDGVKISSGRKYVVHIPQLVDGVAEWSSVLEVKTVDEEDLTNFTCRAHNALGAFSSSYALSQTAHPGPPLALNVTVLSESSALVQWTDTAESPLQLAGYTIRFKTEAHKHYQMVDIPGTNASNWLVEDLIPGAWYSFTLQSYNIHGRPYHTSPTIDVLISTDGELDVTNGGITGDDGRREPEGMPLLMFVLIALTGGALCILNITGALCFLRRRAFFNGFRVSSTRKASDFEVPSPSLMDQLSLSSTDDMPPPDYEQVMGTMRRSSFGGSLDDVDDLRRGSRSSRGTPSLARSTSPIITSSSTISAGMDLDADIIAPPVDFCNGLMSAKKPSRPRAGILRRTRDTWASLDDGYPITTQVYPQQQGSYDLTITHQPSTPGPRPVEQTPPATTFHYSMESLSQLYPSTPQTPQPTPTTVPMTPSQVTYHGQPHIQQQHEQSHQYPQQYQQPGLHFQYPPVRRASPPYDQQQPQHSSPPYEQSQRLQQQPRVSPPYDQQQQHTSPPYDQRQHQQHRASPPYDQSQRQQSQRSSPTYDQRQQSQRSSPTYDQRQQSPHSSPTYDQQQPQYFPQQQQCCYQASSDPNTPVPPPYASLDPSTLYSIHPTYFDDGSCPGTSYSGGAGRSDQSHS